MYLNDVRHGGETAFYNNMSSQAKNALRAGDLSSEVLRIRPERGMAVVFYPTLQPTREQVQQASANTGGGSDKSGGLPDIVNPDNEMRWENKHSSEEKPRGTIPRSQATPDMWHAGCKVLSPKQIAACWVWPVNCNKARMPTAPTKRPCKTDGVIV